MSIANIPNFFSNSKYYVQKKRLENVDQIDPIYPEIIILTDELLMEDRASPNQLKLALLGEYYVRA